MPRKQPSSGSMAKEMGFLPVPSLGSVLMDSMLLGLMLARQALSLELLQPSRSARSSLPMESSACETIHIRRRSSLPRVFRIDSV